MKTNPRSKSCRENNNCERRFYFMAPLIETRKVILFDLDGTILDNMDLMYTSLRDTMAAFGYPELTEEIHATLIGMGEKQAMAKLGIPAGGD